MSPESAIPSALIQDPFNGKIYPAEGDVVPEQQPDLGLATSEARYQYLLSIDVTEADPTQGINDFTPEQHVEVLQQIVATGYPVERVSRLTHRVKEVLGVNENGEEMVTLASMMTEGPTRGELTVHDPHHERNGAARLGTIGHELAHLNTPYNQENADAFGGEEERVQALEYVTQVAEQSIATNQWLDGYHKWLGKNHAQTLQEAEAAVISGEISMLEYDGIKDDADHRLIEETWAILNEKATTDREGLRLAQERQHAKMDDLSRAACAQGIDQPVQKVDLITPNVRTPGAEAKGIDRHLVRILKGIQNYDDLMKHTVALKDFFYDDPKAARKVYYRFWEQRTEYAKSWPNVFVPPVLYTPAAIGGIATHQLLEANLKNELDEHPIDN